jgi:beta-phosphoglucomutase-like phosphatase (HAD superfamily)
MKALIFDVDGTLAETEELHRRAFNQSFADAGLDWLWDVELYGRLLTITGGRERIRHFVDAYGARPNLTAEELTALHAVKTKHYANLVANGALALRPGVERLMREARAARIRLAIATTTTAANIEALLQTTLGPDWMRWFELILASDSVSAKKPASDIYWLALERLGLRAAECVAFEDSLNGLISARDAGIPTVVTLSAFGGLGPFPGALAVVDQLGELGMPCKVLAGPPADNGVVDLTTLADWLRTS